jgi:hypothetical protein
MKPTHPCPDERAIYLGSASAPTFGDNAREILWDYWAHPEPHIDDDGQGSFYLFGVIDDSGSFATMTMPFTTREGLEPQPHTIGSGVYEWAWDSETKSHLRYIPMLDNYLGLTGIAARYLWNKLYPEVRFSGSYQMLLEKNRFKNDWEVRVIRECKKRDIEIPDPLFDVLCPFDY